MKLNVKSVKDISPNKNLTRKIMAIVLSLIVIIISYIVIDNASKDASNTVTVVSVNNGDGIEMGACITEQDITKYDIIKTEYRQDMVLADDIEKVVGKYANYYLRKDSVIYKDQLGEERPITNEWLYNLAEDEEVITIKYNYLECGGDILMPGDRVRIRATYELGEKQGNTGIYGNASGDSIQYSDSSENAKRTDIIFDSIEVKDMLNEDSHSIYEIYKEILRLNEEKRNEIMKSEEFLDSILPRALVLAGTKQEINEYAKYANLKDGDLLITILSREASNPIIDQLPTLQREVESWAEENQE